ncbi:hypothetical protein CMI38_02160 [Candidatus Pacearchaeota archaeon]|nr:hypothetical protein [Candidatus Pacearchaeota archaeon]|tara:strand:+ start:6467 stop:8113 length:1647 start_codon:yes stop_codon:yes gene_type:complete
MVSNQDILNELRKQGRRISKLERDFGRVQDDVEDVEEEVEEVEHKRAGGRGDSISLPKLSFNQIITFIGVVGVIIGAISFFFYAVANNWIGETGQVMIGVILGFVLFGFAFILRKDKEQWSNIVFGGAYFVEYLAIGVGVLEYEVLPDFIGIALALVFLISSTVLSIKFKARVIAYFTLVGGFLIPFITGTFENDLFVMGFYVLLSIGLVVLSFVEHWYDLRFVSYLVVGNFILFSFDKFVSASDKVIPVLFLISIFVLYKLAVLINSFKNKKDEISVLDSIIVVSITVMFLWFIYNMFDFSKEVYGIFVMVFSFLYLIEIFYFKTQDVKTKHSIIYTLLSTGIVCLNLGFIFLISSVDADFFLILFAVEYVLFSVLSVKTDEKKVYQVFSVISLLLIAYWYVWVLGFKEGIAHASFFLFILFCIVVSFFLLFRKDINFKLNAASFIIGGFAFIYSLYKYLWYWNIVDETAHIVLSILWLIYTLVLFSNVETKEGKLLVGGLLGVTLIKIAFNDLFYLEGIFRIIGFIIFGILLIIGGYFIKNESDKK